MNIVVVLEDLNDTGANRVSLDRAVRWQRRGDQVTVLVTIAAHGSDPLLVPRGLTVINASGPHHRLRSALPAALKTLLALMRDADVVVAGTEVGFGFLLSWGAARLRRRPFAVTVQSRFDAAVDNYVIARLRGLTRYAFARADLAVCVSRGLAEATTRSGMAPATVRVAANAVAADELRERAQVAPSQQWDDAVPVVVGVGRLERQKGFDLLIRAHARALADGAPPHQVIILGEGGTRPDLERLCDELGVRSTVHLAGHAANPHAVVSRACLFVLSSRWEGFSLSLAEALVHGTACVAFDCVAGPSEVLDDGRFGQLVQAENVPALADAIAAHLRAPEELQGRAANALVGRPELFDVDAAADVHRAALASLLR